MTTQHATTGPGLGHFATGFLSRFFGLYFLLYVPTLLFPAPLLDLLLGPLASGYSRLWQDLVPWVGSLIFPALGPIASPSGISGDTLFHYLQVLLLAVLAGVGSLVWMGLDRDRRMAKAVLPWLVVACRYYLAFVLWSYGFAKVFQTQFPAPGPERLIQTYGESSPMALAWTFLGHSAAYGLFLGACEVLAGTLLLFRRTTTLGALLAVGILTNVVVMNFSYGIPVKIFSSHLLLMALVLVALDGRRILEVFILNRPSSAVALAPYFSSRRGTNLHRVAKVALLGASLFLTVRGEWARGALLYGERPGDALRGLYEVETFELDGEARPPLTTDPLRWQDLILGDHGRLRVRTMTGEEATYHYRPGPEGLWVTNEGGGEVGEVLWHLSKSGQGVFELRGEGIDGAFAVWMRRRDLDDFPLVQQGFRWVLDKPYLP